MNNKPDQTSTIADKIRLSLVAKLNIRLLARIFSAFLAINILLCLLLFGITIGKAENGMQSIIKILSVSTDILPKSTGTLPISTDSLSVPTDTLQTTNYNNNIIGYRIEKLEETPKGIVLPNYLQKWFPVKAPDAARSITVPTDYKEKPLLEKISSLEYNIVLLINDSHYRIVYALGADLKNYISVIFILLLFEALILIGNIGKGARMIRKTLKPLSEMAKTARNLNVDVSSKRAFTDDAHIKDLAGTISSIDANKLDKRISIDDSQNELKDLARAINDMLNRINEAYRSQVRFVSDASHELRTPISVIQGYANLLDRWGKNDEKTLQESIDAIKSEAENMEELVEQLLFLARGDTNTLQLHMEVFDFSDLAEEIIRETKMFETNHIFEINLYRPSYINADQQLMKQAVRILMDNSIKYTPYGEKISLTVEVDDGFVRIIVQDSGIGIAPEELEHIFDRFYRSDESRARKTGGSGIGLSIAKCIIDAHGGHLEVLSRKDIGTRTTIVMPLAEKFQLEALPIKSKMK